MAAFALAVGMFAMGNAIGAQNPHDGHDAHGQGKIDFVKAVQEHHPEADTDGDGEVSEREAKAFIARMHGDGGPHAREGRDAHTKMEQLHMLLEHIEKLESPTAPTDLDLNGHAKEIDSNVDGRVTDAEWTAFTERMRPRLMQHLLAFAPEADLDEDGEISDAELDAFRTEQIAQLKAFVIGHHPETDTDGDGKLSDAEFAVFKTKYEARRDAEILKRHPGADTNGDGVLSKQEVGVFMVRMHGEDGQESHGGHGDHDGHGDHQGHDKDQGHGGHGGHDVHGRHDGHGS